MEGITYFIVQEDELGSVEAEFLHEKEEEFYNNFVKLLSRGYKPIHTKTYYYFSLYYNKFMIQIRVWLRKKGEDKQ
jgi:hypothetical protein